MRLSGKRPPALRRGSNERSCLEFGLPLARFRQRLGPKVGWDSKKSSPIRKLFLLCSFGDFRRSRLAHVEGVRTVSHAWRSHMSIDTLVTSAPLVSAPVDSVLPRCLAYTPDHVRQADGSYLIRGLRSGSVVSCANVLEVAVCLRLESCGGLRSIVRPDRFASGFSNELRDASRRIASAALTPTFLLQIEAAKRPIVQAVTILAETDACAVDRQATRSAYRSCGMAWTLLTEGWAEWSDAATRLFLTECGRTAPVVAGRAVVVRDAVLRAASDARRDETLADVLIEASLQAGVQPGVAMRE